jgi:FdrA protein
MRNSSRSTQVFLEVLKGEYRDSLILLSLSNEISRWSGVIQAIVVMGTPNNLRLLEQFDFLDDDARHVSSSDLVIAVEHDATVSKSILLQQIDQTLKQDNHVEANGRSFSHLSRALVEREDANLILISVPGRFATDMIRQSLENGRNVFCFSDHVPLSDEVMLKELAISKDLLLMGPECGTSIINGKALGFANQVDTGTIGIVGASGSGLQEVTTLIDRSGGGISHAIGVGGRDMTDPVNGLMTEYAVRRLSDSMSTGVIVILAKRASKKAQTKVLKTATNTGLPIVVNFTDYQEESFHQKSRISFCETYEECAREAISLAGGKWFLESETKRTEMWVRKQFTRLQEGQYAIRGLFTGGSLCGEAANILSSRGFEIAANLTKQIHHQQAEHCLIDLGAEEFTEGRAHPFIDSRLRALEIRRAIEDPSVAVILMDVVLGWNCHKDPAGEVAATLSAVKAGNDRAPAVIASICGTVKDPQDRENQRNKLEAEGVYVAESNAAAARVCADLISRIRSLS